MNIQEKFYKSLSPICKYKTLEEVENLPERRKQLYEMSALSVFSLFVCWRLEFKYGKKLYSDSFIKNINSKLLLIDNEEMEFARYFLNLNELAESCFKMILDNGITVQNSYSVIKDNEDFNELVDIFYKESPKEDVSVVKAF